MTTFDTRVGELPAVRVLFNCGQCHDINAEGHCYEQTSGLTLFMVIPLITSTDTKIKCTHCGAHQLVKAPLSAVSASSPEEIDNYLVRESSIARISMLAGLISCWLPFFGLLTAGTALLFNTKTQGPMRVISQLSLGVAVVSSFAFGVYLAMGN